MGWRERGKQPLTPGAAHWHGSVSQANYERDTSLRLSIVPRLVLYYSSIVPLFLVSFAATNGAGTSTLPTNIPRECNLASGECQTIGGQVLALDDRRQFTGGEFDVAIDEEQVPAHNGSALAMQSTGP